VFFFWEGAGFFGGVGQKGGFVFLGGGVGLCFLEGAFVSGRGGFFFLGGGEGGGWFLWGKSFVWGWWSWGERGFLGQLSGRPGGAKKNRGPVSRKKNSYGKKEQANRPAIMHGGEDIEAGVGRREGKIPRMSARSSQGEGGWNRRFSPDR